MFANRDCEGINTLKLNFAILGTGGIAENGHAKALLSAKSAQLWSVLSRDQARGEEFAQKFKAQAPSPVHVTLGSLLADRKLQAVIIATPDRLHCEQAVACAKAGKHILLEKPMATSAEESAKIRSACEEHHVTLGIAYHLRWHAGHRKVIALVRSGEFGEIRHVRAHWSWLAPNAENWRASSQFGRWWSLAGVGTHCLDFVRWVLLPTAGEVDSMQSLVSQSVWRGPHDETAILALRFRSGATAEIASSVLFDSPSRFEIYGSKGFAICEATCGREGAGRIYTHKGPLEFKVTNPFLGQIEGFSHSLSRGLEPEVSGEEGEKNIALLLRV